MNYQRLKLYEEITLLGLRDEKGTAATEYLNYAIVPSILKSVADDQARLHNNAASSTSSPLPHLDLVPFPW